MTVDKNILKEISSKYKDFLAGSFSYIIYITNLKTVQELIYNYDSYFTKYIMNPSNQ